MASSTASLADSLKHAPSPRPIPSAKPKLPPKPRGPLSIATGASDNKSPGYYLEEKQKRIQRRKTTSPKKEKMLRSPRAPSKPAISPGSASLVSRGAGLVGTKPVAAVSPKRKAVTASGPMRIGGGGGGGGGEGGSPGSSPSKRFSANPSTSYQEEVSVQRSQSDRVAVRNRSASPTKAAGLGRPTTESRLIVEDNKIIEISYDYSGKDEPPRPATGVRDLGAKGSPTKDGPRKKRHGLFEPSAEMLAHFPAGYSGSHSAFSTIPPSKDPERQYGRVSALARENESPKKMAGDALPPQPATVFNVIPDHEARMRSMGKAGGSQVGPVFNVLPDHSRHPDPNHSGPVYSVVAPPQHSVLRPGDSGTTMVETLGGGGFQTLPTFPQPHPQAWLPGPPPFDQGPSKPAPCYSEHHRLSPRSRRREEHQGRAAAHKAAFEAAFGPSCSAHQPLPPPLGGGLGGGGPPTATVKPMERKIVPRTAGGLQAQPFSDGAGGGGQVFIRGGTVVNDDNMFIADVLIEDGVIKAVGPNLAAPAGVKTIDATGRYVLPGGIDTNTHFQLPLMGATAVDDFASGTQAAVAGGTTMVVDVAVPKPGESLTAAYERWRGWADGKVACDYALAVAVPHWSHKTAQEMTALSKEKGVNCYKMFMAFKDQLQLTDEQLFDALVHCRRIGAFARVHAENGDLVAKKEEEMLSLGITGPEGHVQSHPEEAEAEATNRICVLARAANAPVCIDTITSKAAAEALLTHRKRGTQVWGEAVVAALGTDGTHYFNKCWRHAAAHVTSPPLRLDTSTPAALLELLGSGQLHFVGSDHCTFNGEQKALGKDDFTLIPQGVNGVEERMSIVWERGVESGRMDPMRFVAVTSSNAAKALNIYPRKGRIAVGMDADIVVWNASDKRTISAKTHHQAVDFNIFEGQTVHGVAEATLSGGRVVWEKGAIVSGAGGGRFVALPTHSPHLFALAAQRDRACLPQKVDRAPFDGKVAKPVQESVIVPKQHVNQGWKESAPGGGGGAGRAGKPAGVRNQFEASWSFAGDAGDDKKTPSTRVAQPPGGASRPLW